MTPKAGDIILSSGHTEEDIFLLDAISRARLAGPFPAIADALSEARRIRPDADLWHESTDNRGRSLGPIARLMR